MPLLQEKEFVHGCKTNTRYEKLRIDFRSHILKKNNQASIFDRVEKISDKVIFLDERILVAIEHLAKLHLENQELKNRLQAEEQKNQQISSSQQDDQVRKEVLSLYNLNILDKSSHSSRQRIARWCYERRSRTPLS